MKRPIKYAFSLVIALLAVALVGAAQSNQNQPSLGDYARAVKKHKPTTTSGKTFDNDNMPSSGTLNVVGTPSEDKSADGKDADDKDAKSGEKSDAQKDAQKKDSTQLKSGQSAEDRQKAIDAWKEKITDQKGKVDLLSRELDVIQRERQIKQADFYASTARAVQNARGFDQEDEKYKKQIADKQKELDDAKAKLTDLEDQAHKAGAPNSVAE
jgi:hypothetical protein